MLRVGGAVLLGALVAVACGGDGSSADPTPCVAPSPGGDAALLPDDVPFLDHGTLIATQVTRGFLGAQLLTETRIVELYPEFVRQLMAGKYTILSGDNEGFEAEIFFGRGRKTTGIYRMREGPCKGQVTVKLLYGSKRYRGKQ